MDFWKSFELTEKTLRQFVDNLGTLAKTLEDKEKCDILLNRFPFEKLLNVTIMDGSSVILCLKILDVFTNYEDFYLCDDRFNYALEFVLINLTHVTTDCQEIVPLLRLLSKVLCRHIRSIDDSLRNIFDRERILEVLLKMTKFTSVHEANFCSYGHILNRLLHTNFPDSANCLMSDLYEKFKAYNAVMEQSVLCKLILSSNSKILSEPFLNFWDFLAEKCPAILVESLDEDLLENVFFCLTTFTANWNSWRHVEKFQSPNILDFVRNLYTKLKHTSSEICLHTSNLRLRPSCFQLLKYTLIDFFNEEKVPYPPQDQISNQFDNFSEDVERWPMSNQEIFFCICHLCMCYSRMIWKKQDVLNAMTRCFYSRRHSIRTNVLKSIYYLYPAITFNANINFYTKTLGDDLLNYFTKICAVPHLYSYNIIQLKWMLDMAPKYVKLMVLGQWIKASENDETRKEILLSVIKSSKAEIYLFHLILSENLGKKLGAKAALFLRKISNPQVSSLISLTLPLVIDRPICFYHLILAEPGTFLNSSNAALICSLMGAVLSTLTDSDVVKGACIFTSKLLASNKDNPFVLKGFCRNDINIHHLIKIIDTVDDSTAVEIIRLLKVVILIQQRNKIDMGYSVKENFNIFLRGAPEKVEKGLRLLYHSVAYKHSVVTLDLDSILETYQMVLDSTLNSFYQSIAYECVVSLMKRTPWLAQIISTRIHIEMACLSFPDLRSNDNLIKMLDMWLTIIRREPYNGFCPIPETAIRSFFKRVSLTKQQEHQYMKILDDLLKRERTHAKKLNIFCSR